MTDRERELQAEVEKLKADLETEKTITKECRAQHGEDREEIFALRKRCRELEAEQTTLAGTTENSGESGVIEKLFFATELLNGIGDNDGRDYYDALIGALGLTEKYIKWRDERK